MDTTIIPGANSYQFNGSAVSAPAQAPDNSTKVVVPVKNTQESNVEAQNQNNEQDRLEAIKRVLGQKYPLSDSRFTIYRDQNGEYITRTTSLTDGRVTYTPEPRLLNEYPALARSNYIRIATEA